MLSHKDYVHDLIWRYHCTLNESLMLQLISMNKGYIYTLINKYYKIYNKKVEFQDLYQECLLGFMHAVKVFDFDKDTTILTYADFWMRSYMFTLYSHSTAVHIPAHLLRKLMYPNVEGNHEHIEIAKAAMSVVSLCSYIDNNKSKDILLDRYLKPSVDTTVMLFEKYHVPIEFEQACKKLSDLEAYVINMFYYGYKTNEIAEELGIHHNETYLTLRKAKRKIKEQLV